MSNIEFGAENITIAHLTHSYASSLRSKPQCVQWVLFLGKCIQDCSSSHCSCTSVLCYLAWFRSKQDLASAVYLWHSKTINSTSRERVQNAGSVWKSSWWPTYPPPLIHGFIVNVCKFFSSSTSLIHVGFEVLSKQSTQVSDNQLPKHIHKHTTRSAAEKETVLLSTNKENCSRVQGRVSQTFDPDDAVWRPTTAWTSFRTPSLKLQHHGSFTGLSVGKKYQRG